MIPPPTHYPMDFCLVFRHIEAAALPEIKAVGLSLGSYRCKYEEPYELEE